MKNHPTPETWMSHLYGETTRSERRELQKHLAQCLECAAQMNAWQSAKDRLGESTSELSSRNSPARPLALVKWGIAAALVLFCGFALGRISPAATDPAVLRASVEAEVRQTLQSELARERESDRQQWVSLLSDLENKRAADYAGLRKDLETVAVLAEARLQRTQQEIGQLYTQTSFNPNP